MKMLPDPDLSAYKIRMAAGVEYAPVDVNAVIASLAGLEVVEDDLDGEGLYCDLGAHGGQILLKRTASPTRKKFTLAHEIGHFVIRDLASDQKPHRSTEIERWCNRFAASLLMPKELVLSYLRSTKLNGIIQSIANGPAKFSVSTEAFRSRVVEIAPISMYVFQQDRPNYTRPSMYMSEDKHTYWKKEYNFFADSFFRSDVDFKAEKHGDVMLVGGRSAHDGRFYGREIYFALIGLPTNA